MALARAYNFPSLPTERPCETPASAIPPLWLALHFPALALEALEIPPGLAAVIEAKAGRVRIHACTPAVAGYGVAAGMVLSEAQMLCPGLAAANRNREAERRALARLAERCLEFTPWISLDFEDALQLEVRGSLLLFGGPEALIGKVRQACAASGHSVSIGLAPTPSAAWLLARSGTSAQALGSETLQSVLGELPTGALGIDDKLASRLACAGLRVLRDLWRMPRDGLVRRYGRDLLRLLDEAVGKRRRPLRQFHAPPKFRAERELATETEALEYFFPLVEALLVEFEDFLHHRDAAAGGLGLELRHPCAAPTRIGLGLCRPSRDARRIAGLLRERLERIALPGPVRGLRLESAYLQPFAPASLDLFAAAAASGECWDELIDRLRLRLGPQALRQLEVRADRRPERAGSEAASGGSEAERAFRPLWLLPQPKPFSKLGIRILPECERIETGWWDGEPVRRDYHVAVDAAGPRLWVYRDSGTAGPWYLHGLFG
ncbi:MAG: DNA polymerase Y family protein [Methylococcus sp.]|nr:DNA polymerase Y family protein [Methylococcus sp.]